MSTAVSRMQFLRGDFSGQTRPKRPPWAIDEFLFSSICNGCGECITHCPTRIIEESRGNFPVVNFNSGECNFCNECVEHCKPGALKITIDQNPWSLIASIENTRCIAYSGVECRSCYDPCEPHAINMTPRIGGVSIPVFNSDNCTGCGACFAVCPTQAITIKHSEKS